MEDLKNCMSGNCGEGHWCHKKWIKIIIVIAVVMIIAHVCGRGGEGYNKNAQQNTIAVSGKGEITVKPDMATLSFSVTEENLDVSKASDAVNVKIAAIVSVLKADGVDEKDIKTTDYSINPRYNYVNNAAYPYGGKQVLAGYDVTDSISISIKDLSKAGKVVTDLGGLGVTNMGGLTFTSSNQDALVKEARDEAIKQAREDAESLAKSLGVRLNKIVGYSEGSNYPVYYDRAMSAAPMAMSKSEAVLPTGENKITSNVSITYEVR